MIKKLIDIFIKAQGHAVIHSLKSGGDAVYLYTEDLEARAMAEKLEFAAIGINVNDIQSAH